MKSHREIGKILKDARLKKGLTPEKIWNSTRIQGKIVEALEEGVADDVLAKVYALLFLKKYASLLGLDAAGLVKSYKAFHADAEEKIPDAPKKSHAININVDFRKWAKPAILLLAFFISLLLVIFLSVKVRSFFRARKAASPAVTEPKIEANLNIKAKSIFPISGQKDITLLLESKDEVWMKVWKDNKVSFEGTLGKNKKKVISSGSVIRLWVGRAEALDFTVNDAPIGKIGRGNIKQIEISKEGIKVEKKWLIRAGK